MENGDGAEEEEPPPADYRIFEKKIQRMRQKYVQADPRSPMLAVYFGCAIDTTCRPKEVLTLFFGICFAWLAKKELISTYILFL